MKRLSLLKKIALGTGAMAAVTPIALMSTSCAIEDITAEYVTFNSILYNGNYRASREKVSFKRLLFGSKKVNNGNYILFYGSNMFDTTCQFFSGDASIRGRDQWFTNWSETTPYGHFNDSPFFYGIQKTEGTPYHNFGIFNVIDFWDSKVYDKKGHQIYVSDKEDQRVEVISPWAKWTDALITRTKAYNMSDNVPKKYSWDEKSVSTKEYIRNDNSAKVFREFCRVGAKTYPKIDKKRDSTFDISDNNKSSKMLIFKNGVLQKYNDKDINDIPTTKDAWFAVIEKFFKVEQK